MRPLLIGTVAAAVATVLVGCGPHESPRGPNPLTSIVNREPTIKAPAQIRAPLNDQHQPTPGPSSVPSDACSGGGPPYGPRTGGMPGGGFGGAPGTTDYGLLPQQAVFQHQLIGLPST